MGGAGEHVSEIHRRRKVYIIALHRDALGSIVAVVAGELHA